MISKINSRSMEEAQVIAANRLRQGFMPEEATRKDTYAHMDHLLDNLMLQLGENHTIINQDGTEEVKAKGIGVGGERES